MKVGIIGGAERNELQYRRVAEELGHELYFHSGKLSSCGSSSLEALVRRCDLVVIATDTNSHAAVRTARSLMRNRGTEPLLLRRLGVSRLTELLSPGSAAQAAP
jgi:Uncharacterized protein conserved in bacteria (DUF2325)